MLAHIGNLLLVIGTILGGIAAANSAKASREVPLEALPGEFLARDIEVGGAVVASAGDELIGDVVSALQAAGLEFVAVKDPPRDSEVLTDEETFEGRLLATAVPLGEDAQLGKGVFLDAPAVARLKEAGVDQVEVQIAKTFSVGGWELSWLFLLAVVAMGGGIGMKRVANAAALAADDAGGGGTAAGAEEAVASVVAGVREIANQADELSAERIRAAIDPLLAGPVQDFVDGRLTLTARVGAGRFALIMGPFASGERLLNRTWSATVDGYPEEARASVRAALPHLEEALAQLKG